MDGGTQIVCRVALKVIPGVLHLLNELAEIGPQGEELLRGLWCPGGAGDAALGINPCSKRSPQTSCRGLSGRPRRAGNAEGAAPASDLRVTLELTPCDEFIAGFTLAQRRVK